MPASFGPRSSSGGRLLLDRVRVGEVLAELLAEVVSRDVAQRRLYRAVEGCLEPLHHRALLARDRGSGLGHLRLARALGRPAQQLVRRQLERFVRKRVRVQLAGRVRLQAREEQESLAADLHHRVLHE